MDKEDVVYIHNGILFSHEKNEKWMELVTTMLSEMSDRERKILYDFTHIWHLRNKTNEQRERNQET